MFTEERKAVYYGKVEIIRGVICDGYVLDNDVPVMSERGVADLLGMDHAPLKRMVLNWPPEMFKPFIEDNFGMVPNSTPETSNSSVDKDFSVVPNSAPETSNSSVDKDFSVAVNSLPETPNSIADKDFIVAENSPSGTANSIAGLEIEEVEVVADNSPHKGRKIVVYSAKTIETLIRAYAFAFASGKLRKPQQHIGRRGVFLLGALAGTALDAAIREACGLPLHIQQTLQKQSIDAVEILRTAGFTGSVENQIATKKDIINFLGVPMGTLNSFLRKHPEIEPVLLTREQIRALGSFVAKMYGYSLNDVAKMAFSMNTVPGIQLKACLFGELSCFVTPETSIEVNWQAHLMDAFAGFGLVRNYVLGPYRLDFLIEILGVALECNGREHAHYDAEKEKTREAFITQKYALVRFQHHIRLEKLINAILRVKSGEIIRLTS